MLIQQTNVLFCPRYGVSELYLIGDPATGISESTGIAQPPMDGQLPNPTKSSVLRPTVISSPLIKHLSPRCQSAKPVSRSLSLSAVDEALAVHRATSGLPLGLPLELSGIDGASFLATALDPSFVALACTASTVRAAYMHLIRDSGDHRPGLTLNVRFQLSHSISPGRHALLS